MARIIDDSTSGQADHQPLRVQAESGGKIELPSNDFVTDSHILRDGQDLVLRTQDGPEMIVENYFLAEPAPVLVSVDGAALTPALVDSFAKPIDGIQTAQKGSVDDVSPVGMVKEVSGDATITHPNGVIEKATLGTPIYQGDIVETKGDGAVNIMFVDETTFAVSENARLAIDEYVFDPATQSGETNFSVLRGVFVFTSGLIGREDPDDVKIDTPVGSIGIRGTTIMGTINPDGESQITVVEGAIVITNANGAETISEQFETVRLNGFEGEIVNSGTLTGEQVGESYNVLRTVSGQLFSQIDDSGTEQKAEDAVTGEEIIAPEDQPTEQQQDTSPTDGTTAPVDETGAVEPDQQAPSPILAEPLKLDQDEGFDLSAGTKDMSPAANTTASSADSGSSFATASGTTQAPTLAGTQPAPAPTDTSLAPPTSAQSSAGAGTAPSPAPEVPLNLNQYITAWGTTNFIPNPFGAAVDQQGSNVASLGDYDHDGQNDYLFTTNTKVVLHSPAEEYFLTSYGISTYAGLTAASAGDFDGDGIGDFMLGAPAVPTQMIILKSAAYPH
jgi:hypothetical protein